MAEYFTHTSDHDGYDDVRSKQYAYASNEQPKVMAGDYRGSAGQRYMYNTSSWNMDWRDLFKRALKYLLEGLAVALVAYYFTKGKLDFKEITMLGITAAFVFAILDTFSPTISLGARLGAGFGVGQTMFGLNPAIAAAAL
jgi:hypothetical protein